MATTDFGDLDATAQAALVRSGQVSALELVEDAIRRCEEVNGSLNAVITEMYEHARDAARRPLGDGPFAGVPFLMKDFGAEELFIEIFRNNYALLCKLPDPMAKI